jgi:hypothetical protein
LLRRNFSFYRRDPSIAAPYLLAGAIRRLPRRNFSLGRRDASIALPQFFKRPA